MAKEVRNAPFLPRLQRRGILARFWWYMEEQQEQQIQEFVHRVAMDERVRHELTCNPVVVIKRQGFSPRVAQIILHLVPQLAFEQPVQPDGNWWHA